MMEPDASRAMDAPVHGGADDRSVVLILDSSLVLAVPPDTVPVHLRDILQIALATLIADRAVQRVVGKQ